MSIVNHVSKSTIKSISNRCSARVSLGSGAGVTTVDLFLKILDPRARLVMKLI